MSHAVPDLATLNIEGRVATLAPVETCNQAPVGSLAADQLKKRTAQGALASVSALAATFMLRMGSMMILARLLLKEDFGLVNMVTAFTGFLNLFRDAGLSLATVQKESLTSAQASALFWVNLAFGLCLAGMTALGAPLLAAFYREPRLVWVTIALSTTFVLNGASTQHRAMLRRNMRITTLAVVDVIALIVSIAVSISMAAFGGGYMSLVLLTVLQPLVGALGVWVVSRWVPGRWRGSAGIRSMLHYGGAVTLNNVVVYLAYNADKVLLGRYFGAEALGIYGRAYQLINIPSDNLTVAMGEVAFPALSRVQNDPGRLRKYFVTGYSLLLAFAIPLTVACSLFAADIIRVALGLQWSEAVGVFRLLAPTVLALTLINPFGWLLLATGRANRSLMIAVVLAPIVFLGYLSGLPQGPEGVALGYSTAMLLVAVPIMIWSTRGTSISVADIAKSLTPLVASTTIAAAVVLAVRRPLAGLEPPLLRLVVHCAVFFGVYLGALGATGRAGVYLRLLSELNVLPPQLRRLTQDSTNGK